MSDILGTDEDVIYRGIESEVERNCLERQISKLSKREQTIIRLRFGINMRMEEKKLKRGSGFAWNFTVLIFQDWKKRIMKRLKKEWYDMSN